MHKTTSILLSVMVVACTYPPTSRELSEKYINNPAVFDELSEMVREDAGSRKCFEVGTNRIGNYDKDVNGNWSSVYGRETQLDYSQVLSAVNLSEARYDKYTGKLESLGARGITYCKDPDSGSRVSVFVAHSGFCRSTINWNENLQVPSIGNAGGDFHEITSLRNGWYAEVSCS